MIGNPAYPTYQAFLALGIAAVITAALMPLWIRLLKFEGIGQQVRADGPSRHLVKQGTPTMGGVVILIGVVGASLLVARPSFQLILAIGATLATGALGLFDDISSVSHGRSLGLTPRAKMFGLTVIVVVFFTLAVNFCGVRPVVVFPGGFEIDLGALTTTFMVGRTPISIPWLYFIFVFLLLAGMSNAVNLTDGLDGLAILPSVMVGGALGIFAYVVGRPDYAGYLIFPYIPGAGELVVIAGGLLGAGLAFLWYNAHPAQVFMGDVGALALGGCLGTMAVITRQELVLAVMGGIFVVETLSVMIQTVYFRLSHGKRIFLMAPVHHHFELKGWKETQVVTRFWIITMILVLIGLSTLKIR